MPARAAGEFRRTPLERADQQVSWERSDQAFFAAGACHVLAWTCRALHPGRGIGIAALRLPGEPHAFHVYATWDRWAFDHAGWSSTDDLRAVNAAFEGRTPDCFPVDLDLAAFCEAHHSRMPHQYWRDPVPRARAYVERFTPPWVSRRGPR